MRDKTTREPRSPPITFLRISAQGNLTSTFCVAKSLRKILGKIGYAKRTTTEGFAKLLVRLLKSVRPAVRISKIVTILE